jgi:hypothetical protein
MDRGTSLRPEASAVAQTLRRDKLARHARSLHRGRKTRARRVGCTGCNVVTNQCFQGFCRVFRYNKGVTRSNRRMVNGE